MRARGLSKRRRHFVAGTTLAIVVALMAAFAGFAGPLPIGREVIEVNGVPQPVLVFNPAGGTVPSCADVEAPVKVVVPSFALVKSMPSLAGTTLHILERGQLIPALAQNGEGWWQVPLPGACDTTGWVSPETFRTVRVVVADGQGIEFSTGGDSGAGPILPPPLPSAPAPVTSTPTPVPTPFLPPTPTPLFGDASGSAGIVVSQALTLRLGTVTGANGLVAVNDEGTRFTIAAETNVGGIFMVHLALCNKSGNALNGELQLTPVPIAGAAKADDITGLAQFGPATWKFIMDAACNDFTPDLILTIRVPDDLPPGFGGFTGVLRQVAF